MDDDRTAPSAAFALRLSADILSLLVVTDVVKKAHAELLITESLNVVIADYLDHEDKLRSIAATVTQQVRTVVKDRDRLLREQK